MPPSRSSRIGESDDMAVPFLFSWRPRSASAASAAWVSCGSSGWARVLDNIANSSRRKRLPWPSRQVHPSRRRRTESCTQKGRRKAPFRYPPASCGEVAELVESAPLLRVYRFTPIEGSNPSLSATQAAKQRLAVRIRGRIRKSSRIRGVLAVEVFRFRARDSSVQGRFETVGSFVSVGHFGGSGW